MALVRSVSAAMMRRCFAPKPNCTRLAIIEASHRNAPFDARHQQLTLRAGAKADIAGKIFQPGYVASTIKLVIADQQHGKNPRQRQGTRGRAVHFHTRWQPYTRRPHRFRALCRIHIRSRKGLQLKGHMLKHMAQIGSVFKTLEKTAAHTRPQRCSISEGSRSLTL